MTPSSFAIYSTYADQACLRFQFVGLVKSKDYDAGVWQFLLKLSRRPDTATVRHLVIQYNEVGFQRHSRVYSLARPSKREF